MSQTIECFWLKETDQVEIDLRRYVKGEDNRHCALSTTGYHDATCHTGEHGPASSYPDVCGDVWTKNDPRWPKNCVCGYAFKHEDYWQFHPNQLYRRADTGQLITKHQAPAGAMLHATWLHDFRMYVPGPDGIILLVKLPNGVWWSPDGPSMREDGTFGNRWRRTGTTEKPTAYPSIDSKSKGSWHGWLENGVLKRC